MDAIDRALHGTRPMEDTQVPLRETPDVLRRCPLRIALRMKHIAKVLLLVAFAFGLGACAHHDESQSYQSTTSASTGYSK
jgi:hypothetical protein